MIHKLLKIIIISLVSNSVAFATEEVGAPNCDRNVQHVIIGNPSPCTGYLFSPQYEREVRVSLETLRDESSLLRQKVEQQSKLTEIANLDRDSYKDKFTESENARNAWYNSPALHFISGMLVTGLTVYLVKQ